MIHNWKNDGVGSDCSLQREKMLQLNLRGNKTVQMNLSVKVCPLCATVAGSINMSSALFGQQVALWLSRSEFLVFCVRGRMFGPCRGKVRWTCSRSSVCFTFQRTNLLSCILSLQKDLKCEILFYFNSKWLRKLGEQVGIFGIETWKPWRFPLFLLCRITWKTFGILNWIIIDHDLPERCCLTKWATDTCSWLTISKLVLQHWCSQ